jgi:hypothetical protein
LQYLYLYQLQGVGGSSKEPETAEKGSLNRIFKLVDESGRESGTLVLTPMGGAELRDPDGNVIGSFAPAGSASEPVAKKADENPPEEKVSDEDKKTE